MPPAAGRDVPERILDVKALRTATLSQHRGALEDEFMSVPTFRIAPEQLPPGVGHLNRYRDVLPPPATRVPLQQRDGDPTSEYINANFVTGYNGESKRFIAAQGPTPATIPHFWAMLWEQNVQVIAMMTGLHEGGRIKCERYWPELGKSLEDETYKLTTTEAADCGQYVLSLIDIVDKASGTARTIRHFWYTAWPDHGVPKETWSVIDFVRTVRKCAAELPKAPILVHCSAGIGRTGTFVAIDIGMQELQSEWRVCDIYGALLKMRKERAGSVQTFVQYLFIHQALLDYVTPGTRHSMFGAQEPRDVGLIKPEGGSFGVCLRGSYPAFIVRLAPEGVAKKNGVLLGDHVLAVNQTDVREMAHREVTKLIAEAGAVVTLTLLSKERF